MSEHGEDAIRDMSSGLSIDSYTGLGDIFDLETPSLLEKLIRTSADEFVAKRVAELTEELSSAADPVRAAIAAHELGVLFEREYLDDARASKAYRKALASDPTFLANLWAVRCLFHRRELWQQALKLAEAEGRITDGAVALAGLHLERAFILEHEVGDLEQAEQAVAAALKQTPELEIAQFMKERYALGKGDWDRAAKTWQVLAETLASASHRALYMDSLASYYGRGADFDSALAYSQQALEIEPDRGQYARSLLRLAEASGNVECQVRALRALSSSLLKKIADDEQPASYRERLHKDLAGYLWLEHKLIAEEQPEVAWRLLEQAATHAPTDPVILADLAELAESLGRYEELAETMEVLAAQEADPARLHLLSLRRSQALRQSGSESDAGRLLESLRSRYPGAMTVVGMTEWDALSQADWARVAAIYADIGQAADRGLLLAPAEKGKKDANYAAWYLVAAGAVYGEFVGDRAKAESLYRRAIELAPGWEEPVEALAGQLLKAGRAMQAVAQWKELAKRADKENVARYAQRQIAALAVLELDTGDERDKILSAAMDGYCGPNDAAADWWLYAHSSYAAGQYSRALLAWQECAKQAETPHARAACLTRAARIALEQMEEPETAEELITQAIAYDDTSDFVRQTYITVLRARHQWTSLVSVLRAEAARDSLSPEKQRQMLYWAADVAARNELIEDQRSILLELLEDDPSDAVALLLWLRSGPSSAAQLCEVADRIAPSSNSSLAKYALAKTLMPLDPRRASQLLRQDSDESFPRVLLQLECAAHTADAQTFSEALVDMSSYCDATTTRELSAFAALLQMRRNHGDVVDFGADTGLLALAVSGWAAVKKGNSLAALRSFSELRRVALIREVQGVADYAAFRELVVGHQAGSVVAVMDPIDYLLKRGGSERLALAAEVARCFGVLEGRVRGEEDSVSERNKLRAKVFQKQYEQTGDLQWLIAYADVQAVAGDLEQSFVALQAALASDPKNLRLLLAMMRVAMAAGDGALAARVGLEVSERLMSDDAKLAILRLAHAQVDAQHDPPEVVASILLRIMDLQPDADEVEVLMDLCEREEDFATMMGVLQAQESHCMKASSPGSERLVSILVRRAKLRLRLGHLESARNDIDTARSLGERTRFVQVVYADVLAASGNLPAAQKIREQLLDEEVTPDVVFGFARGELELEHQIDRALELVKAQLDKRVATYDWLALAAELYRKSGDNPKAAHEWQKAAELAHGADKIPAMLAAADAFDDVGDREAQMGILEAVLDLEPTKTEVAEKLASLYEEHGEQEAKKGLITRLEAALLQKRETQRHQPEVYRALAFVYRQSNRLDAANVAEELDKALSSDRLPATLSFQMPEGLKQLGDDEWLALEQTVAAGWLGAWRMLVVPVLNKSLAEEEIDEKTLRWKDFQTSYPVAGALLQKLGLGKFSVLISDDEAGARWPSRTSPVLALSTGMAAGQSVSAAIDLVTAATSMKYATGLVAGDDMYGWLQEIGRFAEGAKSERLALSRKAKQLVNANRTALQIVPPAEVFALWVHQQNIRILSMVTGGLTAPLIYAGSVSEHSDALTVNVLDWAIHPVHLELRRMLGVSND